MTRDNSNLAQEVARQAAELEEKEGDLVKANGAIQVLREELNSAIAKINELKDAHQRELEDQKKTLEEHESTIKRQAAELAEALAKYEGLLKGGDHADNQTKGFITNLETQVLELKKSSEKNK
jgi:chromosome segregation ATPase